MDKEKIGLVSDIKKIERVLKKFTIGERTDREPREPKLKIIFIYSEKSSKINGYLYAYDINDGYFRKCILDDLDTGEKLNIKCAEKLIKKLISYCKKEDMDIYTTLRSFEYGKSELDLYKKIGFKMNKKERTAIYFT